MGLLIGISIPVILFGSIFWGAFIMVWAKNIGKIENAGYGKCFGVSVLGWTIFTVLYAIVIGVIAENPGQFAKVFSKLGIAGAVAIFTIIEIISFGISGTIIWKESFGKSVKGTLIVPLIGIILTVIGASMVAGIQP